MAIEIVIETARECLERARGMSPSSEPCRKDAAAIRARGDLGHGPGAGLVIAGGRHEPQKGEDAPLAPYNWG